MSYNGYKVHFQTNFQATIILYISFFFFTILYIRYVRRVYLSLALEIAMIAVKDRTYLSMELNYSITY